MLQAASYIPLRVYSLRIVYAVHVAAVARFGHSVRILWKDEIVDHLQDSGRVRFTDLVHIKQQLVDKVCVKMFMLSTHFAHCLYYLQRINTSPKLLTTFYVHS